VTDSVYLPLRTVSLANQREHWGKKARRAKSERQAAYLLTNGKLPTPPCVVKLVRVAPRGLDDDNLRGSMKSIRDGVADRLGIDDRDPSVVWEYDQQRGKPKEYAVIIEARAA
jgi:hypothetical protein